MVIGFLCPLHDKCIFSVNILCGNRLKFLERAKFDCIYRIIVIAECGAMPKPQFLDILAQYYKVFDL